MGWLYRQMHVLRGIAHIRAESSVQCQAGGDHDALLQASSVPLVAPRVDHSQQKEPSTRQDTIVSMIEATGF